MLADKAARRVADEQTRMRIAAEVFVAMDNGVHINPLLRQVYGGSASTPAHVPWAGEAASGPMLAASTA